jgi:hypothetical protein
MKTTLLFSTVLLLSAASFAQTKVKNSEAIKDQTSIQSNKGGSQVNNSGNASSATTIQSNAVYNAGHKSHAEIKKEKKAMANEKHTVATKAKEKGQESKQMASEDRTVSASAHSNTRVNASEGDNNVSNNASLNNGATVSSTHIKNRGNQLKDEEKSAIKTQANATIENTNHVKTNVNKTAIKGSEKIKTASSAAIHARAASARAIHPRPASIKMGTMVKTNAGIRIR